uniref:Uncharacterized protein n=1 Tax=Steinernema glaseri TaxID=37863 RepID=A0A1I8AEY6_9BILA
MIAPAPRKEWTEAAVPSTPERRGSPQLQVYGFSAAPVSHRSKDVTHSPIVQPEASMNGSPLGKDFLGNQVYTWSKLRGSYKGKDGTTKGYCGCTGCQAVEDSYDHVLLIFSVSPLTLTSRKRLRELEQFRSPSPSNRNNCARRSVGPPNVALKPPIILCIYKGKKRTREPDWEAIKFCTQVLQFVEFHYS